MTGGAFWQRRFVPVQNLQSFNIPPHGAMEVVYCTFAEDSGEVKFHVKRPTEVGLTNILFNSHEIITSNSSGAGTLDFPCGALFKQEVNPPEVGEIWGTVPDEYRLLRYAPGFEVMGLSCNVNGGINGWSGSALVKPACCCDYVIYTPSGGIPGASGNTPGVIYDVSDIYFPKGRGSTILDSDGNPTGVADDVDLMAVGGEWTLPAVYNFGGAVAENTYVTISCLAGGGWHVTVEPC